MTLTSIAIIGAGIAGLSCATRLAAAGRAVTLFDKGRRPGGRVATRRLADATFNHGAQYATARGPGLSALMADLAAEGRVAAWPAAEHGANPAWVGLPGMSDLARAMEQRLMAKGTAVLTERHASFLPGGGMIRHHPAAEARPGSTSADGGTLSGPFDAILLALPSPQAAPLLATFGPIFAGRLDAVSIAPCWAVMAVFDPPIPGPDVIRPAAGPLAWIARDSARPGRAPTPDCWMLHASAAWSRAHLEADAAIVTSLLLAAFAEQTGVTVAPTQSAAHRWRYAQVEKPLGAPFLWDAAAAIGVCGDWCIGPRIEAAFDSGAALAEAVLAEGVRAA